MIKKIKEWYNIYIRKKVVNELCTVKCKTRKQAKAVREADKKIDFGKLSDKLTKIFTDDLLNGYSIFTLDDVIKDG